MDRNEYVELFPEKDRADVDQQLRAAEVAANHAQRPGPDYEAMAADYREGTAAALETPPEGDPVAPPAGENP